MSFFLLSDLFLDLFWTYFRFWTCPRLVIDPGLVPGSIFDSGLVFDPGILDSHCLYVGLGVLHFKIDFAVFLDIDSHDLSTLDFSNTDRRGLDVVFPLPRRPFLSQALQMESVAKHSSLGLTLGSYLLQYINELTTITAMSLFHDQESILVEYFAQKTIDLQLILFELMFLPFYGHLIQN